MAARHLNEFRLVFEWESGDGVGTPELAATWARLEVWAGDNCVTSVEDRASSSARRSIYVALYPLAEWVAYNWWALRSHLRLAGAIRRPTDLDKPYAARSIHNFRAAADGFLWPNLVLVPEGETTRVVWSSDVGSNGSAPSRFISEGAVVCSPASVDKALRGLVENVLARLDEQGIPNSRLADEWQAVVRTEADPEEATFCTATARLGLDPYSLDDEKAGVIATIGSSLESGLLEDFFDAVDPRALEAGVMWVASSSKRLRQLRAAPDPLIERFRTAMRGQVEARMPWEKGWEQARRVRALVGVDSTDPFEVDDLVRVSQGSSADRGLVALGGFTPRGGPALITGRPLDDTSRRFATARALWYVAATQQSKFLLTSNHTDRQKVERAFAAELLAPAEGVETFISEDFGVVDYAEIEQVGHHFGVSPFVIQHQVENQLELAVAD